MGWQDKEDAILKDVKVLVVGAGGIGCELLKNLVLTGFKKITVIDLDTIDVSNLNRQFLFRREHVGSSKAQVATASVKTFAPDVDITHYHDSIFSDKFHFGFFQEFNLVLNALDNQAARKHVNRMCIAARIPLVESGSAGYLGQVTVIMREKTECYECNYKPPAHKTYPGCTIRNTPSEHIHCTVWAKHVFNQLFGEVDIDDDVSPDVNDDGIRTEGNQGTDSQPAASAEPAAPVAPAPANGSTEADLKSEEETDLKPKNTRMWAELIDYDPVQLFNKLFSEDISYLCKMTHLWAERNQPVPLSYEELNGDVGSRRYGQIIDQYNQIWTRWECREVFTTCIQRLKARRDRHRNNPIITFDKDDEDAMNFVTACANIRAGIFHLQPRSAFEVKAMAGNIIPAIATTNAMVAGMIVTEALKLARGHCDRVRNVFIPAMVTARGKALSDEIPPKPLKTCFVCSHKRECYLRANPNEMTVKGLADKVLKGALNMLAPDVTDCLTQRVVISSEEGEIEGLDHKKLAELGLVGGTMLSCDDFQQKLELTLIIMESMTLKGEDFEILQDNGAEVEKRQQEAEVGKRKFEDSENIITSPFKKSKLEDGDQQDA